VLVNSAFFAGNCYFQINNLEFGLIEQEVELPPNKVGVAEFKAK
jgi:hypothetical protein